MSLDHAIVRNIIPFQFLGWELWRIEDGEEEQRSGDWKRTRGSPGFHGPVEGRRGVVATANEHPDAARGGVHRDHGGLTAARESRPRPTESQERLRVLLTTTTEE